MNNEAMKEFLEETISDLVKKCNDLELLDLVVQLLRQNNKGNG